MASSDGSGSPCPEALDALDNAPADLLEEVLVPERCHREEPGHLDSGAVGPDEKEHPPVALSPAVAAAKADFVRANRFSSLGNRHGDLLKKGRRQRASSKGSRIGPGERSRGGSRGAYPTTRRPGLGAKDAKSPV